MEENVSFFLGQALAPATLRSYRSGQSRYRRFCQEAGLQPLPLTEQVLCMFVAHLGAESLAYQTLKCYLSAIRHLSIMAGQGDPFGPGKFPVLQYVLRGVRRNPKPAKPRLPITPEILRHLKNQWAPHARETDYKMLWAACCVGFFGFLTAGEFTTKPGEPPTLSPQDVAVDDREHPTLIRIHLKSSKTDPFRHGVDIYLGRTGKDLCPVGALLAFMAARPARQGPLFVYTDGTPLTRDRLVETVRRTLQQARISPAGYSGHSFCIGAATTAAHAGLEDSVVKMLGRWESSAYQRYIKTPRETLAAFSSRLVS